VDSCQLSPVLAALNRLIVEINTGHLNLMLVRAMANSDMLMRWRRGSRAGNRGRISA
jgi:hypothetical protein